MFKFLDSIPWRHGSNWETMCYEKRDALSRDAKQHMTSTKAKPSDALVAVELAESRRWMKRYFGPRNLRDALRGHYNDGTQDVVSDESQDEAASLA